MLNDDDKALADGPNFATLTTLMPDGQPQTNVMWIGRDGDHLVINTETHRQKYKNVQRHPRVTVTIIPHDNPYRYVEVRGRVVETETGETARAHIDELAHKYLDQSYPAPIETERVMLRIAADRQRTWAN